MFASLLLSCGFPLLEAVPSLPTLLQELLFFSTFSFQNSVLFLCKTYTSSQVVTPSILLSSSFCLLRSLTAVTGGTSRCQGKREHEQKHHHSCADSANKDISRTKAVQPKENTNKAKHNTQMDMSCRHCRIWQSTRDTNISIYIFQKQQQRGRDSSNINPQQLNQEKVGGPSDLHSILLPKLNCIPQLSALLPSAQTSVSYLHHLRHGFIAIVVQRTISVSEVVLEACQVDFVAYVKCQRNGNQPRCWMLGFLQQNTKRTQHTHKYLEA